MWFIYMNFSLIMLLRFVSVDTAMDIKVKILNMAWPHITLYGSFKEG